MTEQELELWDHPTHARGIPPGKDQVATLTAHLLPGESRPALIVCPGSDWRERASHEGAPIAEWLNRIGFAAFVLNYRVLPYPPIAAISDAVRAVRYVRHHAQRLRVDPVRIGMVGFSGGGFLSAFVGTHFENSGASNGTEEATTTRLFPVEEGDDIGRTSARLSAMVLGYPLIRMTPARLGGELTGVPIPLPDDMSPVQVSRYFSNDEHVTELTPPTFLWVTASDQLGLCPDALSFAHALSQHRAAFELHVFPRGGHGLGLATNEPAAASWTEHCERWLRTCWA